MANTSQDGARLSKNELEMARQFSETSAKVDDAIDGAKKGKESPADLKKEVDMWEHKVSCEELASRLNTHLTDGMTEEAAAARLAQDGPNQLSPPKVTPWYVKLALQFTNFFALLLILASILCFVGFGLDSSSKDNLYLGIVLAFVVTVTALFTFFQEFKSDQTMEKFKNFLPPVTVVHRGGKISEIDASQLVVGDVIDVKLGDKIPADIRIISNQKLKVDNSSLTGESEPLGRTIDMTDENPLETKNLAFFGTLAIDGTATGIVVNTGDRTVFGRIAGLAAGGGEQETTLQKEIHHFIVLIAVIAITLGIIFFIFGLIKKTSPVNNVVFTIGIIVANVPEGLLATVTVSLTLTAKRMARKQVLVKKLEAVETLGSTTTICSDKTGTLTQNRMTIVHVVYDQDIKLAPTATQQATYDTENPTYKNLFYLAANCAKAKFDDTELQAEPDKPIDERKVNGDASEAGILKFSEKQTSVAAYRAENPQVSTIPFNSANKFMVTINKDSKDPTSPGNALRLCMKGAPERVLDRCSQIMINGETRPITDEDREKVNSNLATLMAEGERVLGFAQMSLPKEQFPVDFEFDTENINFPMEGLVFVGLMALLDPPRESVPGAVETCLTAGVDVFMVTGDHPATAKSIAKQVGIIRDKTAEDIAAERGIPVADVDPSEVKAIVVPGSQIRDLTVEDWDRVLAHEQIVFARTSPQQKLIIVENCQRLGKIVAVTGDGVNDSPALKKANIGVAMGISGSDVSKEAADMVLLDDNFSSIVNGIEEGRLIFDNLKKSIAYTLSSNIPEILPFILFIVAGFPLFLSTIHILLIDLGTDIIPAISFAYETAESDIMRRKPRRANIDRLVNRRLISFAYLQIGVIQALAGTFVAMVVLNDYGIGMGSLFRVNNRSNWASSQASQERWMYAEKNEFNSVAGNIQFFNQEDDLFKKFFTTAQTGFIQQKEEEFRNLEAGGAQFNNMLKIIGSTTGMQPCRDYSCTIAGTNATNNPDCFDVTVNTGPVEYQGIANEGPNSIVAGGNVKCFDMWSENQQRETLDRARTAYLISIIQVQWADGIICKSRLLSVFQHGMRNRVFNIGLIEETLLGLLFTYVPFLNTAFQTAPLRVQHLVPALPFAVFIFVYDEVRKFLMRHGDKGGTNALSKFGRFLKAYTYW